MLELDDELEVDEDELDELELLAATPDDDELLDDELLLLFEDELLELLLELEEELLDDEPLLPLPLITTSIQPWKRS